MVSAEASVGEEFRNNTNQVRPPEGESPLAQLETYRSREGNLMATVPLELIFNEDVPVDAGHVSDLADSIEQEAKFKKNNGQLSPLTLAEVEGYSQLVVLDGFHRTDSLKKLRRETAFATIREAATWENVIDLRIIAAHSHKEISFSRIVEWVEDAWSLTPWADKISATQAFTFAFVKSMTGSQLELAAVEIFDIKKWVDTKCKQWHVSAGTIWNNLNVASIADPGLVKEARARKSGHILEAVTPGHLKVIAQALPYRFELQRFVAEVAVENKLTAVKTRALAQGVASTPDLTRAMAIVNNWDWDQVEPVYSSGHARRRRRQAEQSMELNLDIRDYTLKRLHELFDTAQSLFTDEHSEGQSPEISPEASDILRAIGAGCLALASLPVAETAEVVPLKSIKTEERAKSNEPVSRHNRRNNLGDEPISVSDSTQALPKPVQAEAVLETQKFEARIVKFLDKGSKKPALTTLADVRTARRAIQEFTEAHPNFHSNPKALERYRELNTDIINAQANTRLSRV